MIPPPFHLISGYLDIEKVASIGSTDLTRMEILNRFKDHLNIEERKLLVSKEKSKLPKHVDILVHLNTLKQKIEDCQLLDPRTKAILYTYLVRGGGGGLQKYRDLYIWFIDNIVQGNLEIRELNGGKNVTIPEHFIVFDRIDGSFRIYLKPYNQVIGYFDRCSRCMIAQNKDIDLAIMIGNLYYQT